MNMYQYRRERLLSLIDAKYGSRKAVSDASGWSEARISQILSPTYRDGRAFSEKIARKLEEDLKLEALYFDQGSAPAEAEATRVSEPQSAYQRVRLVDQYSPGIVQIQQVQFRLSAGIMGFETEPDYESGTFNIDLDWVRQRHLKQDKLVAIRVTGESMEPALYKDDVVVVNTEDKKPVDGEVFAVNYEGEAVVKRMSRDAGQWWLASDNPDQRRFHRKLCEGDACLIIGRIVLKKSERI